MHPEFARRFFPWLVSKNGRVGIGSGYRAPGVQPDATGFAKPGSSFHEGQQFPSGRFYTALDLVVLDGPDSGFEHDAPHWDVVPIQGSAEAALWGVHCNIGKPGDPWPKGESWHMQPIELDGYDTWVSQGRPDLVTNYGVANTTDEHELDIPLEIDMAKIATVLPDGVKDQFALVPLSAEMIRRLGIEGQAPLQVKVDLAALQRALPYALTPR